MKLGDLPTESITGNFLLIHGWILSRVFFSFVIVTLFVDVTFINDLFVVIYYWFIYLIIPTLFIGTCLDLASHIREIYDANMGLAVGIGLNAISSIFLMLILYNIGEHKEGELKVEVVETQKRHNKEIKKKDEAIEMCHQGTYATERKLYTCRRYKKEKIDPRKSGIPNVAPDYIPADVRDMYNFYVQEGEEDFVLQLEEQYAPKN